MHNCIISDLAANIYRQTDPNVYLNGIAALRDYCEQDVFNAECPAGQVVLMQEARYGRMGLGTCLKHGYGSLNCFRLVTMLCKTDIEV